MAASLLVLGACSDNDNGGGTAPTDTENPSGPTGTVDPVNTTLSGDISEDMTLTADEEWAISGFVYVEEGVTLTVEAGAMIKSFGKSALIIERGGKIMAKGTASEPIVFTSSQSSPISGDWAGIVILGKAPVSTAEGESPFEANPDDLFGGDDASDNSGTLEYVVVEYAGLEVAPEKELNGITFGGVGSGTTVSYVQVHEGQDDGFEWFGGTVDGDHLIATAQGDDGFDVDVGFTGSIEYALNVQDEASNSGIEAGDKAFEGFNTEVNFSKVTIVDNEEEKDASLNIKANVEVNIDGLLMVGSTSGEGNVPAGLLVNDESKDNISITNGYYTGAFGSVESENVVGTLMEAADAVMADGFTAKADSDAADHAAVKEGDTWHTGWTTGL